MYIRPLKYSVNTQHIFPRTGYVHQLTLHDTSFFQTVVCGSCMRFSHFLLHQVRLVLTAVCEQQKMKTATHPETNCYLCLELTLTGDHETHIRDKACRSLKPTRRRVRYNRLPSHRPFQESPDCCCSGPPCVLARAGQSTAVQHVSLLTENRPPQGT